MASPPPPPKHHAHTGGYRVSVSVPSTKGGLSGRILTTADSILLRSQGRPAGFSSLHRLHKGF